MKLLSLLIISLKQIVSLNRWRFGGTFLANCKTGPSGTSISVILYFFSSQRLAVLLLLVEQNGTVRGLQAITSLLCSLI